MYQNQSYIIESNYSTKYNLFFLVLRRCDYYRIYVNVLSYLIYRLIFKLFN